MGRCVLDYSKEELEELPTEELERLLLLAGDGVSLYNTRQLVEKTMINSLYGALGNKYFPLFNEAIASAITGNGRYFIRKLADYIEKTLQGLIPSEEEYIIYGDTDSVYYHIEPFMDRYMKKNPGLTIDEYVTWADGFEKKVIQPTIQRAIEDFANELNAYNKDKIGAEREIIADAAVFTGKKHYFARVRDSEGTRYPDDSPYLKVMGLEIIKSSTPKWAKEKLKEAIPKILDSTESELRDWLRSIKGEYLTAHLNDIASVGGASNLDYKLNDKGIPIGSRAAIRHNEYIEKMDLLDKYAPIQPDEKARRLFLIEPNKFGSNIIAYTTDSFHREIDCVDYDENFQKSFMKPLSLMVEPLNYDIEKETESLDDW